MSLAWPHKDPDEVLTYQLEWEARLAAGETILTSVWTIPVTDGVLVIDSDNNDADTAEVVLSAGSEGYTYELLNRITTSAGHTMDQTVKLRIKSK